MQKCAMAEETSNLDDSDSQAEVMSEKLWEKLKKSRHERAKRMFSSDEENFEEEALSTSKYSSFPLFPSKQKKKVITTKQKRASNRHVRI